METRSKNKLLASFGAYAENASLNQVTGTSLGKCEDQIQKTRPERCQLFSGMHMSTPPPHIQRVNVIKGWGLRNYDSSYNKGIVDFEW